MSELVLAQDRLPAVPSRLLTCHVCCVSLHIKARTFTLSNLPRQVRVNFPNGDMVGHTGKLEAAITACTATDKAVKVRHLTYMVLKIYGPNLSFLSMNF